MFFKEQSFQGFLRWAFYIFIATFPFILYEGYLFNGTSTRAVNTVVFVEVLAIVFAVKILSQKKPLSVVFSPITGVLILLLVSFFTSSVLGVDFHTSFWSKAARTTGLFYFVHMALLYCLFWIAFDEEKPMRIFLKTFLVSSGIFSTLSVFGQEGTKWLFESKPWDGLMIGNSTFAGMYLYAGFMLAIYFVTTQEDRARKWWKNFIPVLFIFNPYLVNFDVFRGTANIFKNPTSIIGSAQASSIALFVSIFILFISWCIWKIKNSRIRKIILFFAFVVGILGFSFGACSLLTRGGKVQEYYLERSTATRPIVWEFSQKSISERPFFGWGIDNFDVSFQKHYDNSILEKKNGGEAWLDRAHNIFIDQTIETGYVGISLYLLAYLTILLSLFYVILKSKERADLVLSAILFVYFIGHLLEIQTAFDTTITYPLLVFFSAISAMLFFKTRKNITKEELLIQIPLWMSRVWAIFILVLFFGLLIKGAVPILKSQSVNGKIRQVGSSEKRIPLYPYLFSSPLDKGTFLWRTSNDIQIGVSLDPKVLEDQKQREGIKKEIEIIVSEYEKYLETNPEDYRAILNLADMYIYQKLFGVDNLEKAQVILDRANQIVPQSPQPYWMKSVAYLYQAKFKDARESAKNAYDINPGIEESTRVVEYIDKSIQDFPEINLYSFKQI